MAFSCCCGRSTRDVVASKNASELDRLEKIGLSRGAPPRLQRQETQVPVTLNVYSLLGANKRLSKMGMGIYHTGVVVYGIEWGYGEVLDNPTASGLFCVHPGQAAGDLYRTIRIGHTTKSPMQVDTILHRMENEWRSCEYHILHHNCNHFAQALCNVLSTTEKLLVPAWCNRAARVSDKVVPKKLATKVQRMMDEEPPKAVAPAPEFSPVNEIPVSVIPVDWYLHPSIQQPLRYHRPRRRDSIQESYSSWHSGSRRDRYSVDRDTALAPGYRPTPTEEEGGRPFPPLPHQEDSDDEAGSESGSRRRTLPVLVSCEHYDGVSSTVVSTTRRRRRPTETGSVSASHRKKTAPLPSENEMAGMTFHSAGASTVSLPAVSSRPVSPVVPESRSAPAHAMPTTKDGRSMMPSASSLHSHSASMLPLPPGVDPSSATEGDEGEGSEVPLPPPHATPVGCISTIIAPPPETPLDDDAGTTPIRSFKADAEVDSALSSPQTSQTGIKSFVAKVLPKRQTARGKEFSAIATVPVDEDGTPLATEAKQRPEAGWKQKLTRSGKAGQRYRAKEGEGSEESEGEREAEGENGEVSKNEADRSSAFFSALEEAETPKHSTVAATTPLHLSRSGSTPAVFTNTRGPLTTDGGARTPFLDGGKHPAVTPQRSYSLPHTTSPLLAIEVLRRNSARSDDGFVATPHNKSAHTPMATYPRRPSLFHRERLFLHAPPTPKEDEEKDEKEETLSNEEKEPLLDPEEGAAPVPQNEESDQPPV